MDSNQDPVSEFDIAAFLALLSRRTGIIAATFAATLSATGLYLYLARPVYIASTLVLIEKEERAQRASEGSLTETSTDDYYQTQYRLLKSRTLLQKTYDSLELAKTTDFGGKDGFLRFTESVVVSPIVRSRLVHVSVEAHEPELAARASNAVAERFVAQNLENKLFISKEILAALRGRAGQSPASLQALPAVVNNQLIQNLKSSYATLEARLGDLSGRYTAEHPERRRLEAEMTAVQRRIESETHKIIEGMKAELSGQMLGNNVRIIDPAEPPAKPAKPRRLRSLAAALVLGLAAGCLLAFAAESLDQTVHSQDDVERKLKLPFLGALPRSEGFSGLTADEFAKLLDGPQSVTGEALKNIRTMIGFSGVKGKAKTLLVTSTVQGEGKTFLAINLAMAFTLLGERVLLIEGDLRRPNLHKRFGLSKANGLSTYLAHAESVNEVPGLLQDTSLPGLKVLVCGPIPPNPAELLSTPRLRALLEWAQERYDRIIVDGTPVFPVTDALLWGNLVDASLVVVQFGGVNARLTAKACQRLTDGGLRIAGVVLNQVTWRSQSYGDYYYHYKYADTAET